MRPTTGLIIFAGAAVSLGSTAVADSESWSSDADEVRALVAEMLADSETRSSLLQSGGTAGHDGKFFLASPDGNFRLNVGGQVQFRYTANFRDDDGMIGFDDDDDGIIDRSERVDDFEGGFQTRRTKLTFSGHVYEPELRYKVQGAFDRAGGAFILEDAYVEYDMSNGWSVRWGQFKLPLLREELVSSKYQLAADRSVANELFNQGRSQGIQVTYADEMWRFRAAFSDGLASANSDLGADPADWAITGRVEVLIAGEWSQFKDFTSEPGSDYGVMVGAAGHFEQSPDVPGGTVIDRFSYTVDASVEGDGWNVFAAFIGNTLSDVPVGLGTQDADNFAFVVQGGLYVAEDIEIFARYDHIFLDDDVFVGDDEFKTLTAGANYYMYGHAAKFTADVQWFFDSTDGLFAGAAAGGLAGAGANTGIGLLDSGDEDGQIALRFQFQLLF